MTTQRGATLLGRSLFISAATIPSQTLFIYPSVQSPAHFRVTLGQKKKSFATSSTHTNNVVFFFIVFLYVCFLKSYFLSSLSARHVREQRRTFLQFSCHFSTVYLFVCYVRSGAAGCEGVGVGGVAQVASATEQRRRHVTLGSARGGGTFPISGAGEKRATLLHTAACVESAAPG